MKTEKYFTFFRQTTKNLNLCFNTFTNVFYFEGTPSQVPDTTVNSMDIDDIPDFTQG